MQLTMIYNLLRNIAWLLIIHLHLFASASLVRAQNDIIVFDFEQGNMDGWELTGNNFLVGEKPVHASVATTWERGPCGYHGNYYLETGHDNGRHTNKNGGGTWLSPVFQINRNYLNFYLAGQLNPGVRVFLEVDGKIVREAFGNNFYDLILRGWDVKEFQNKNARLGLEDRSDYRSLIRLDHVFLSNTPPPEKMNG
jgi:hypothetical protein